MYLMNVWLMNSTVKHGKMSDKEDSFGNDPFLAKDMKH